MSEDLEEASREVLLCMGLALCGADTQKSPDESKNVWNDWRNA